MENQKDNTSTSARSIAKKKVYSKRKRETKKGNEKGQTQKANEKGKRNGGRMQAHTSSATFIMKLILQVLVELRLAAIQSVVLRWAIVFATQGNVSCGKGY